MYERRARSDVAAHDLVIRGGALHASIGIRPAAVVVDDGRITSLLGVDEPVAVREQVRLAVDEVLIPGAVDSHVRVQSAQCVRRRGRARRRSPDPAVRPAGDQSVRAACRLLTRA